MIDEKQLITELELEIGETYNCDICYGLKQAIEIVKHRPLVGEWIPCSSGKLPELTEGTEGFKQSPCCLVAVKWWDGDITESVGWYNQSGEWSCDSSSCKAIAWMPLPKAYKEEVTE